MIKVAIVGASVLTENEERDIQQHINFLLDELIKDYDVENITIVSGGAKGVDSIAENLAKQKGIKTLIFKPEVEYWLDIGGKMGYKSRNLKIVEACDKMVCFPCAKRDTACYHCNSDKHQVGGGCWTMKKAKEAGKTTELIEPIIR